MIRQHNSAVALVFTSAVPAPLARTITPEKQGHYGRIPVSHHPSLSDTERKLSRGTRNSR